MKKTLICLATALAAQSAIAGGYTVQGGSLDGISRYSLGYTADPVYASGNFQVVPVYEVARFHQNSAQNSTLYQVSAVPMLRYFINSVYVEAGIGVSLFNHVRLAEKNISTAFQFSDHIGVGYRFNDTISVGYRFSHFSNGAIKHPNPGINAQALVLTVAY